MAEGVLSEVPTLAMADLLLGTAWWSSWDLEHQSGRAASMVDET